MSGHSKHSNHTDRFAGRAEVRDRLNDQLLDACARGRAKTVPALLAAGADPNARAASGQGRASALHLAAGRGNAVRLCSVLIGAGARLDATDAEGRTPLDVARQARGDAVARLLEREAARERLLGAIRADDQPALDAALDAAPDLLDEAFTRPGLVAFTPLCLAVSWRRSRCVARLLERGASVNVRCGSAAQIASPLALALEQGAREIAELVASRGLYPRNLRTAAATGDAETVEALANEDGTLNHRAAPAKRWRAGASWPKSGARTVVIADALRYALFNGRERCAALLLQRALADEAAYAAVVARERSARPLEGPTLAKLVQQAGGAAALLSFLLARGHVLHVWGDQPAAPWLLDVLAEADGRNVVDLPLLQRAADAARRAGDDTLAQRIAAAPLAPRTPRTRRFNSAVEEHFLYACQRGQREVVDELLAQDPALVRARNKWGQSGLHLLGAYASPRADETARALIAAGADVRCGGRWTPLLTAALWGSTDVARALIDGGADLEQPTSALWMAATASDLNGRDDGAEYVPMVELLVASGARLDAVGRWGSTPWGTAASAVRRALERAGAARVLLADGLEALRTAQDDGLDALRAAALDDSLDARLLRCYAPTSGVTPALAALDAGDEPLARAITERKGGANLDEAAALGDAAQLEALLRQRYDYSGRVQGHGDPLAPLHFAAYFGQSETARALLDAGYSMAATNDAEPSGLTVGPREMHGKSPLEIAAARGQHAVVDLLLDHLQQP